MIGPLIRLPARAASLITALPPVGAVPTADLAEEAAQAAEAEATQAEMAVAVEAIQAEMAVEAAIIADS
jgi:hypothetical protein